MHAFRINLGISLCMDYKWYYVEVILKEISINGHGNNTYYTANKSCEEIIDENTEYIKRLGFKTTEKKKQCRSCTGFITSIRIQQVPAS